MQIIKIKLKFSEKNICVLLSPPVSLQWVDDWVFWFFGVCFNRRVGELVSKEGLNEWKRGGREGVKEWISFMWHSWAREGGSGWKGELYYKAQVHEGGGVNGWQDEGVKKRVRSVGVSESKYLFGANEWVNKGGGVIRLVCLQYNNGCNMKLLFATHIRTTCSRDSFRLVLVFFAGWRVPLFLSPIVRSVVCFCLWPL